MKSIQLRAVILFWMYTQVHGRMETVHCKIIWRHSLDYEDIGITSCEVRIVEDSQQPISAIIFDEIPNTCVNEINITGKFEIIPDLSDATKKFVLKGLVITDVGLKIVKRDRLAVFEKISELDLRKNEISELDADTFEGLPNLKEISLRKNSLKMLPVNIFQNNRKLKFILLDNNKLTEIHSDTLKDLENLYHLSINDNHLEMLPANIFRDNKKLNKIFLNNNKLRVIHSDTFKGLNDLQFLHLSDNQIEVLPEGLFDDNIKMVVLELQGNKLMNIETDLYQFRKLIYLSLAGNVCIDQTFDFYITNSSSLFESRLEFIENVQQKCT